MMILGFSINKTEELLNSVGHQSNDPQNIELADSFTFRKTVVNAGYKIVQLLPVFHQGWEMDEWAAIVEKEGRIYKATTNHGSLSVQATWPEGTRIITDWVNAEKVGE